MKYNVNDNIMLFNVNLRQKLKHVTAVQGDVMKMGNNKGELVPIGLASLSVTKEPLKKNTKSPKCGILLRVLS